MLGGPVDVSRLAALAGCLAADGWLVIADPLPADMTPIEHALARRRLFLAAGLEPYREPPPRGRGVIEAAAWIARRRVSVEAGERAMAPGQPKRSATAPPLLDTTPAVRWPPGSPGRSASS